MPDISKEDLDIHCELAFERWSEHTRMNEIERAKYLRAETGYSLFNCMSIIQSYGLAKHQYQPLV